MSSPYHHPGFHREFAWLDAHPEPAPRPRNDHHERIALPSIRQAFPELQLQVQHEGARTPPTATSPTSGPMTGTMTPPEYVHSPNYHKRRRLSFDDERDAERASQVPRLYAHPERVASRQQSPPAAPRPAPEAWANSTRTSPYVGNGALPSMRSPVTMEIHERAEPRPTLPSLPLLNFERGAGEMHRIRNHSGEDYPQEPMRRPSLAPSSSHSMEAAPPPGYRPANYGYGFHHSGRAQSLSVGSIHPFDRTPFSSGPYGQQFQDAFMRMGDFGMAMNGDSKQRKRRGNLPKETTDKLSAWFVAHLHHPYPTEDEKQELMRQTGLQMNQISNWFINARRRRLPTMINNARAESDAMTGRGDGKDGKVLPSTERLDYDHDGKQLSDGEGSNYDDVDMESMKPRRATTMKRGSV